jgi:hypothetical protein
MIFPTHDDQGDEMSRFLGIRVDAGASIDVDCPVTYAVDRDTAEFEFGHHAGTLHLSMTESALARFIGQATVALDEMRRLNAVSLDRPRESV